MQALHKGSTRRYRQELIDAKELILSPQLSLQQHSVDDTCVIATRTFKDNFSETGEEPMK